MSDIPRPPTRRHPLGEATRRVNNSHERQRASSSGKAPAIPHHESLQVDGLLQVRNGQVSPGGKEYNPMHEYSRGASPGSNVANPRLSAIFKEHPNSNRNSQISTVSTNASDGKRIKASIGPWKLGKTLGKGATARVRLARHAYNGTEAAIKIVQKRNAQMSQAGSLAALDQAESGLPESADGLRRMPVGIEREVAIMKLIQHPNIMKLYDIWENRTEIYLVLEYVDNGELFDHISRNGRLGEEEAVKYFRQMLSAVGYCHSFNICHRDLKPENILLTKNLDIKIADFGMAALHQSPDHKLQTSCGSPHYAAPELIKGATYRGDKVDIWSMGVILFAMLAGRLPFDVEGANSGNNKWLGVLLGKIRKGEYEMDPDFSEDAQNLIWRILQVNPRDRINLDQIWRHPLIRQYDYVDDLGRGPYPQSPTLKDCGRPVLRRSDINKELLRHLRSMWHTLTEQQLMEKLLTEEPNDQKLFYSLLMKYRDAQLENYTPDGLGYSTSDYHHTRPQTMTKTYSTCHFPQPKSKNHTRQTSRFTVISNVAETEQSYDPFKASRPQHIDGLRSDRVKVTIHRDQDVEGNAHSGRPVSRASSRQRGLAPPRGYASRSSLASSTRSRQSGVRAASYKRGVSFSHMRKHSSNDLRKTSADGMLAPFNGRHSNHTEVTDDGGDFLRPVSNIPASTRYIRSRKAQSASSQPLLSAARSPRASLLWNDDVRQLSTSLANDCDEAFNRSSVVSNSRPTEKTAISEKRSSTGDWTNLEKQTLLQSVSRNQPSSQKNRQDSFDTRPLPPPPERSESTRMELLEAKKHAEMRKGSSSGGSPGYIDRMVSHIDRLIQPNSPVTLVVERRALSVPLDARRGNSSRPLPSIYEARAEDSSPEKVREMEKLERQRRREAKNYRIASAPEPRATTGSASDRYAKADYSVKKTIRMVNPSSPISPVKMPAPLTIRKKSSMGVGAPPTVPPPPMMSGALNPDTAYQTARRRPSGLELYQQYLEQPRRDVAADLGRIEEDNADDVFANDSNSGTIIRKKTTWFRRSSKEGAENAMSIPDSGTLPSHASGNDTGRASTNADLPSLPKKKGFSIGRFFKKRSSKPDMTVGANDVFNDNTSVQESVVDVQQSRASRAEDARARQIEPQQNWLAKLFHVKPVALFVCFSVSKRRARQEITIVLKDWRKYGIRDVQIDKERNIVFGKVAAKNYLEMKEVAFAGEIMTVIEHGKRSHLSIARFTQERGAASSFHKVVETLETVLRCRGVLVADDRKKRMMVKTLNVA